MWKTFFSWLLGHVALVQEVAQLRRENEERRQREEALERAVERILWTLEHDRGNTRHELEKMALRLENEMLKFEKRLPPPKDDSKE